jgi:hypothetical protein
MFLKSRNLSLSELSDTDTVPSISISKEYIMYRVEENEENSRTVTFERNALQVVIRPWRVCVCRGILDLTSMINAQ